MASEAFKANFESYVNKYGDWVVYIRTDPAMECMTCNHVEGSGEAPADCPGCFGTGKATSIEKVQLMLAKTRLVNRQDVDIAPGIVVDGEIRAQMKADTYPIEGDLVLEVAWNCAPEKVESIGEPISIVHVYKIEQVEPQYMGRVVFYTGVVELLDFKKSAITRALFGR